MHTQTNHTFEANIIDGRSQGAMMGIGETYLIPFAIFLGLKSSMIGVLSTLPLLAASLMQLFIVRYLSTKFRSKQIVFIASVLQIFSWIPLLFVFYLQKDIYECVLISAVFIYFLATNSHVPSWQKWMSTVFPKHQWGEFFAKRESARFYYQAIGLIVGGAILWLGEIYGLRSLSFIFIFAIAALLRVTVVKQVDRMTVVDHHTPITSCSVKEIYATQQGQIFLKFVVSIGMLVFASSMINPYFAIHVIETMNASSHQFMFVTLTTILSQAVFLPLWGKLCDHKGSNFVLNVALMLTLLIPLMWLVCINVLHTIIVQIFAGCAWAAMNVSMSNRFMELLGENMRLFGLALSNVILNLAAFSGAFAGGIIIDTIPHLKIFSYLHMSEFAFVCLLSFGMRGALTLYYLISRAEVRTVVKDFLVICPESYSNRG